jgi:hypothetical protein
VTKITFTRRLDVEESTRFHQAVWFDSPWEEHRTSLVIMRWLSDSAVREAVVDVCPAGTMPLQKRQIHRPVKEVAEGFDYQVRVDLVVEDELQFRQVTLRYAVSHESDPISEGEIEFLCIPEPGR